MKQYILRNMGAIVVIGGTALITSICIKIGINVDKYRDF